MNFVCNSHKFIKHLLNNIMLSIEERWYCEKCDDFQYMKNIACGNCGNRKPVGESITMDNMIKKGDWTCFVCASHQFSYRNSCRDCGTPKMIEQNQIQNQVQNQEHIVNTLKQKFNKEYYLVLDFEANCSADQIRDHEIIEFPAVLVNSKTGIIIAEFRSFVKMITHKQLSTFIKNLTHITDEQVKNGLEWSICLQEFEKWCHQYEITFRNTTIVTCGDWDLKTMLHNQLQISKTKLNKFLNDLFGCWTNVRIPFGKYTKAKAKGMEGMLKYLKINLVGHHHSGIDDCRNTVKICHELTKMGCDITTPTSIRDTKFWYGQRPPYKICDGLIIKC